MSILRPINYAGAWEFKSPVPVPAASVGDVPLVSISFNSDWIPAVFSALKALTRPECWVGTLADINRATSDAHSLLDYGTGGSMTVGLIVEHMLASLPANWLACDGASHLRVDFPALYAVLDSAYIIDADHFRTPNLLGRSPIGVGSGSGLTPRAVNAIGGEETHILTVAEMASHNHWGVGAGNGRTTQYLVDPTDFLTGGSYGALWATTGPRIDIGLETTKGSDTGHNNMPPFTAVKYAVIAA